VISAVVLAAGQAQSSGETKFFLPLRGKPLLQWVLENALASELDEIICVARELATARRLIKLSDERLFWLINYSADQGQSSSLIAGLWATHPKSDGVMFLLGDQPFVRKELINSLIECFAGSSAWIVAPSFNGEARAPILLRRELFPELLQLTGDRSGHTLIERHRNRTALVECKEELSFLRLDDPAQYERMNEFA
jgi:molybdenum cofactor cytidylyltransferase